MKKLITFAIAAALAFSASAQELDMVQIPGKNFKMLKTEVTQELYESVMGENPSFHQIGSKFYEFNRKKSYEVTKGEDVKKLPVERVSWYDAIYFCNMLSMKKGLTPVYAVDGEIDVAKWNYTPHRGEELKGKVTQNVSASGFRLPTKEEWEYAAKGGEVYEYSGSNNLDEVSWYYENSNSMTHVVAKKKPNGYGLYDMSGNVREWCWDSRDYYGSYHYIACGGSWRNGRYYCEVDDLNYYYYYYYYYAAYDQDNDLGFRIVCNVE